MTAYTDNPAKQLRIALQPIDGVSREVAASTGWCTIWHLPEDRSGVIEVLRCAAVLSGLADEVRHEASLLSNAAVAEVASRDFDEIEELLFKFGILNATPLRGMLDHMSPLGWRSLEMLDVLFDDYRTMRVVDSDEIEKHIGSLQDLIKEIRTDQDLDPATRVWILRKLNEVLVALMNVQVLGPQAVDQAVDILFGSMVRDYGDWQNVRGQSTSTFEKVNLLIVSLTQIVTTTFAGVSLAGADERPQISYTVVYEQPGAAHEPPHIETRTDGPELAT